MRKGFFVVVVGGGGDAQEENVVFALRTVVVNDQNSFKSRLY